MCACVCTQEKDVTVNMPAGTGAKSVRKFLAVIVGCVRSAPERTSSAWVRQLFCPRLRELRGMGVCSVPEAVSLGLTARRQLSVALLFPGLSVPNARQPGNGVHTCDPEKTQIQRAQRTVLTSRPHAGVTAPLRFSFVRFAAVFKANVSFRLNSFHVCLRSILKFSFVFVSAGSQRSWTG